MIRCGRRASHWRGGGCAVSREETVLATPQIEAATTADIPALVQLRLDQGWHRQDALLEALQSSSGGRTLIVREAAVRPDNAASDRLIATTGALAAPPVGVIGNVIVRAG